MKQEDSNGPSPVLSHQKHSQGHAEMRVKWVEKDGRKGWVKGVSYWEGGVRAPGARGDGQGRR